MRTAVSLAFRAKHARKPQDLVKYGECGVLGRCGGCSPHKFRYKSERDYDPTKPRVMPGTVRNSYTSSSHIVHAYEEVCCLIVEDAIVVSAHLCLPSFGPP